MSGISRGFTLVEVLVAVGLVVIVTLGIFGGFRFALELTAEARAQSAALSLASGQMEFIRSLEYDQIGTVGGIPAGPVPQFSTSTLSGREFTTRTLIYWVDDPADGLGASDVNNITTDYKEAKVEVSWESLQGTTQSLFLLSRFTPQGIESNVGGGTIRIEVYDRNFAPLPGVSVQLRNETTTSTIDVTQNININGFALFSGAPAASQYEVLVTRPGYSTEQTYRATTTLPNPSTQPFTVAEGDTTVLAFRIDQTSDLLIRTLVPATTSVVDDVFAPPSTVATTTGVELVADTYQLELSGTQYVATGTVESGMVSPATFSRWDIVAMNASTTLETNARLQVVTPVGTSSLSAVPNTDLPGNSSGFSPGAIDISQLDPAQYPELGLLVSLETASSTLTPALRSWSISYVVTETAQSGVPIRVRSNKTIGTDGGGANVYKYDAIHTSDGTGEISLSDMEWDTYQITPETGWAITSACPPVPYDLDPGVSDEVRLDVVPDATPSLRVQVMTGAALVPGAIVQLTRPGVDKTATTDACGQVFFTNTLVAGDDYTVQVNAPGYAQELAEDVAVSTSTTLIISVSP